jgi:large subunit ribosomal protein L34
MIRRFGGGWDRHRFLHPGGSLARVPFAREVSVIKRTFQPKKRYRRRVHGFLRRMSSPAGARLIQNRRRKGRSKLTPS